MSKKLDQRYLDFLFKEAQDVEAVSGARVAACLVFKKTLIVLGTNQNRTDPMAARFSKNDDATTIHAEVQAIKNAINHYRGDYDQIAGAVLYVCRAKREERGGDWTWGLAKPCDGCMKAVEFFNLKRVVYSEEGVGNYSELP